MKVVLIHGIHAKEGNNNMSELLPYIRRDLPGVEVDLYQYGFMGFWQARWQNNSEAEQFADYLSEDECIIITHSNGAAITYLACKNNGLKPNGVININPALDRWKTSPTARWVLTIHSDQDRWVDLAQWLPFHPWGDQGKVGYKGDAQNTVSLNASEQSGAMAYGGHCDLFERKRIGDWSKLMCNYIAEREII